MRSIPRGRLPIAALAICLLALTGGARAASPSPSDSGRWIPFGPPSVLGYSVDYDPPRHRLLVYGGNRVASENYVLGPNTDLWWVTLDGRTVWTRQVPIGSPPANWAGFTHTYDPIHDQMVFLGGSIAGVPVAEGRTLTFTDPTAPTWKPLTFSSAPPPPRAGASAAYDPARGRIIAFGGAGPEPGAGAYHNVLWEVQVGRNDAAAWEPIPMNAPPPPRASAGLVWDGAGMILFGGRDSAGYLNDSWRLALRGDSAYWTPLNPGGIPPTGRSGASAFYDSAASRVLVYGGVPYPGYYVSGSTETWALALGDSTRWALLATHGNPQYAEGNAVTLALDPVHRQLVGYRGHYDYGDYDGGSINEILSVLDLDSLSWHGMGPGIGSSWGGLALPQVVYDSSRDRAIVMDRTAITQGSGDTLQSVWSYSLGDHSWTAITPEAPIPTPNWACYDAAEDRLVALVGRDVWVLGFGSAGPPHWQRLAPGGPAPALGWFLQAVFDPERDRVLVFTNAYNPTSSGSAINTGFVWQLSLGAQPEWRMFILSRTPGARNDPSFCFDASRDRVLMSGGEPALGGLGCTRLGDVWALDFSIPEQPTWHRIGGDSCLTLPNIQATSLPQGATVYDPVQDRVWAFGGIVSDLEYATAGCGLAEFGLRGDTAWTLMHPPGDVPAPRFSHSAIFDPRRNQVVVFGGIQSDGGFLEDAWAYQAGPNRSEPLPEVAAPRIVALGNPARGTASFEFEVPATAQSEVVEVDLFDAFGRRIGTLFTGLARPGRNLVTWNGEALGTRAASGIYFARLKSAGLAATRKLIYFR